MASIRRALNFVMHENSLSNLMVKSRALALTIRGMNDMWWSHCFSGVEKLSAVYGTNIPPLTRVVIHDIRIHRRGPTVEIQLELAEFPSSPPKKWMTAGYNRVQIQLVAFSVTDVKFQGGFQTPVCDLEITSEGNLVMIKSFSDQLNLQIETEFLSVGKISAYCSE